MAGDLPLDRHILAEAAQWLTAMQEAPLTAAEQARFGHWRNQSPAHQRAWARAERLLARIDSLPLELARPTLGRPDDAGRGRRAALKGLATLLLAVPAGWLLWRQQPWQHWLAADYVAGTGEQLDATLDDGSQVTLNTATQLDVRFGPHERLLRLRKGEIYVRTAADSVAPSRPFLVQSTQGRALALGARFSVRQLVDATLLAVYEGAVQIQPARADAAGYRTLHAGEQARFDRHGVARASASSEAGIAWRNGLLMADDMPLPQWAAELARYGTRDIIVAPSARHLRISGAFPTNDLSRALRMLAETHRVRVQVRGQAVQIGA